MKHMENTRLATLRLVRHHAEAVAQRIDQRTPPLRGRCVELALLVRVALGGDIVGRFVPCDCEPGCEGTYHYWNRLADGTEYDLTSDQFGGDGINPYFDNAETQKAPGLTPPDKLAFIALVAEDMERVPAA